MGMAVRVAVRLSGGRSTGRTRARDRCASFYDVTKAGMTPTCSSSPLTIGMWSRAAATSEDLDTLRRRVTVLENNSARGREDKVLFKEQTTTALAEVLKTVSMQPTSE